MSSYRELLAADRRLIILRLLAESAEYRANAYLLASALPGFGHSVSHDTVAADLAWLDEQGLASTDDTAGLTVATITARGADVAAGRARHPGVKRPEPEA